MHSLSIVSLLLLAIGSAAFGAETPALPELQGILVVGQRQRFALVSPGGAHSGWIGVGDRFGEWRLVDYRPADGSLVLGCGDVTATVALRASVVREGAADPGSRVTVAEADAMLTMMKFDAMWDRIAAEQKKGIVSGMRPQVTAEFAKSGLRPDETEALLDKMGDALVHGMQSDAVRQDFARIFSEVYTKDELRGMAEFYDTPAGRAWADKQPDVQQKLMQALMPRVMAGMPAAQKIAADYLRQRAAASAPAK